MATDGASSSEDESNDHVFFPRSEYRTRFDGTTFFEMSDKVFWNTYFRSTAWGGNCDRIAKYTRKAKSDYNKNVNNTPQRTSTAGSFPSPFHLKEYEKIVNNETVHDKTTSCQLLSKNREILYDYILRFKITFCKVFINEYEERIREMGIHHKLLVRCNNDYPCILVYIPELNSASSKESSSWYKIAQSYFSAFANNEAKKRNVPIEIVIRASFGHNIPSLSETKESFRINVGIVPEIYATVLVESLIRLNNEFLAPFLGKHEKFKLKLPPERLEAINREILNYNKRKISTYVIEKEKKKNKRQPSTVPEWPPETDLFSLLSSKGNSKGNKVCYEITRMNKYVELLADYAHKELIDKNDDEVDLSNPLKTMLAKLTYSDEKASVQDRNSDYLNTNFKFNDEESENLEKDNEFWDIVEYIFKSLTMGNIHVDKKVAGLYSRLEKKNLRFIRNCKRTIYNGRLKAQQEVEDKYGSDSECEIYVPVTLIGTNTEIKYFCKKVIFTTGMKAINFAHYLACVYAQSHVKFDTTYMYYEASKALTNVKNIYDAFQVKINPDSTLVKYIDLCHCQFSMKKKVLNMNEIRKKISTSDDKIIVFDYTSAQTGKINEVVERFLEVFMVILLVSSGIKNEQIGADMNPYGTLRIITKNKSDLDILYSGVCFAMAHSEMLPPKAHFIRRAYKNIGAALCNGYIFKNFKYISNKSKQFVDLTKGKVPMETFVNLIAKDIQQLKTLIEKHKKKLLGLLEWKPKKIELLGSEDVLKFLKDVELHEVCFELLEECFDVNPEQVKDIIDEYKKSKTVVRMKERLEQIRDRAKEKDDDDSDDDGDKEDGD